MSLTPDSTLADPHQIIADLRRKLTEAEAERDDALERLAGRTAERDEALVQQAATADVLGVINASPGDLTPVFDAILEKATRVCEAVFGVLLTWDGERFQWVAFRGLSTELVEALQRVTLTPGKEHPVADRIVRGEMVISMPDLREEAHRGVAVAQAFLRHGARSCVTVALRKEEKLLGHITIYRREVRPFTDNQIALLQNFAAQAVIAMENARLITETRAALEQQTATAEVLGVINSSPGDLMPVFDAILDKAHVLCSAAYGVLMTFDGEAFRVAAARGEPSFIEYWAGKGTIRPPEGTPLWRVMRGGPMAHIHDAIAENSQRNAAAYERLIDLGRVRTLLIVPLRKDDTLRGVITAFRQEIRPFSDKQIALLQNFAAQAVIAMENARLITETREALEQQTATAEVLGVINSSPGNLAPVFDAILEKAMRLCEAAFGVLWTFEGEIGQVAALSGVPPAFAEFLTRGPHRETSNTANSRLRRGENVVQIADSEDDDAYRSGEPVRRAMVELGGARTMLAVPLRKDGALLGSFIIYRQEVRLFSDKQIALLQGFAAQAVIAMENARLITETREALEQQTATAEVLGVINSSPGDLAPVFDAMLERALALCGASFGMMNTYDGERFHAAAVRGVPEPLAEFRRRNPLIFVPGTPPALIEAGENVVHRADVMDEPSYKGGDPMTRALVELGRARTLLVVALRKDQALLGTLSVYRQEVRPFTDKQIALLQNFAAQAVIAMENARLLTETREALEQQTATAEVLGVINASPGDLKPVFEAILEKARSLCGATFGALFLIEGERIRAVALRGGTEVWRERMRNGFQISEAFLVDPLLAGERFVQIIDVAEIDHPLAQAVVKAVGTRTLLTVPLRKNDVLFGMIIASRHEVRPFSEKQIALLQNFAAQAVVAMENARLLGELHQRTDEVAELNRGLEARVAEQVDELGRVGRLKRFLAPQLAELIVSHGDEKILESHRREIVVVFCDLRGYTGFTETAEPEEVLDFLREYHGALGPLVTEYEGTLDQFSGDGIMVFFNDPVPIPDPAERAVKMAMAMREAARDLIAAWRRRGRELGFGAGIAQGYATLGQIGFAERSGYTAIGTVCNVAARLCAEAKDGQILLSQRVAVAIEGTTTLEEIGALTLKGLTQPVVAFNVR